MHFFRRTRTVHGIPRRIRRHPCRRAATAAAHRLIVHPAIPLTSLAPPRRHRPLMKDLRRFSEPETVLRHGSASDGDLLFVSPSARCCR